MKKLILLFIVLCPGSRVLAQQDPLYSQYITNPFILNPAYAGLTNNLNMAVNYRNQWSGMEGGPKTINANGHISLSNNKMGAGMMLVSDQIGGNTITEVLGSYSYRIQLTSDKILSFGLQGGFANYKIDNSKVTPYDKTDPNFQGTYSETKPSIGFGLILKNDKFFVGFSVPRMLESTFDAQGVQNSLYSRHYYVTGSYLFFVSERIRFKPSAMLKLVSGAPASIDLNASLILHENYQAGVLTRNFNTYGLFLQAMVKDHFRIGYVFEVPTGTSVGTNFSTHEITVGVSLNALRFHSNSGVLSF
jgi:type IX secretion system PorP/SprF family membrane protein